MRVSTYLITDLIVNQCKTTQMRLVNITTSEHRMHVEHLVLYFIEFHSFCLHFESKQDWKQCLNSQQAPKNRLVFVFLHAIPYHITFVYGDSVCLRLRFINLLIVAVVVGSSNKQSIFVEGFVYNEYIIFKQNPSLFIHICIHLVCVDKITALLINFDSIVFLQTLGINW